MNNDETIGGEEGNYILIPARTRSADKWFIYVRTENKNGWSQRVEVSRETLDELMEWWRIERTLPI